MSAFLDGSAHESFDEMQDRRAAEMKTWILRLTKKEMVAIAAADGDGPMKKRESGSWLKQMHFGSPVGGTVLDHTRIRDSVETIVVAAAAAVIVSAAMVVVPMKRIAKAFGEIDRDGVTAAENWTGFEAEKRWGNLMRLLERHWIGD